MNLTDIRKEPIRTQKKFLAGRGRSSGLGKTCGVGGKGQWGRAGTRFRPYFEGGQMSLIRRIPKRGFNNNQFRTEFELVSLAALDAHYANGATVDEASLREKGLLRRHDLVKVTAEGKLTKKLTVRVHRFTGAAAAAIAKAGGVAEPLPVPDTRKDGRFPAKAPKAEKPAPKAKPAPKSKGEKK